MSRIRLLAVTFLILISVMNPLSRGPAPARAAVPQASGTVPWHPHYAVAFAGGVAGSVDLADGHFDLGLAGMQLPGRGLPLTFAATWDSVLALAGTTGIVGQGVQSTISPRMSGAPGSTVTYTADDGSQWVFTYSGGSYQPIPGLPWSLTTNIFGYTLTNILTGATRQFDSQGRLTSQADSYGNTNTLSYGSAGPTSLTNSGGRTITLAYNSSNLLSDVKSPLWVSSNGAQGQHVALSYGGSGCGSTQLCALTRGAGTADASTTSLSYGGNLLQTVKTGGGHVWQLGWDASNRLVSITSPISGTVGQAGYTPSYTTQISYGSGTTTVTQGYGTPSAVSTTYTLDGSGEPTAIADGLGHTSYLTYDGSHDVLTTKDPDTNLITTTYTLVGGVGLPSKTTRSAITPAGSSTPQQPWTSYTYSSANDLVIRSSASLGATAYSYDGHHGILATASVTATVTQGYTITYYWRGQSLTRDAYGEVTSVTDGRGLSIGTTTATNANPTTTMPSISPNGLASWYTAHSVYDAQGDLTASATAPITTTLNGVTSTGPVTTTYSYDADGDRTAVTSPNGETTTVAYDHLGRPVSTTLPRVTLYDNTQTSPTSTITYDGDGNLVRRTDAAGGVESASYDPLGRQTGSTDALGATTIMTYTATALTATRDPLGRVVATYAYDGAGRLTGVSDALGDTRSTGYDAAGNVTSGSIANGGTTVQTTGATYDPLNELATSAVGGPGATDQTTSYQYDLDGNVAKVTYPDGAVASGAHDLTSKLTAASTNALSSGNQESFGYDPAANLQNTDSFDSDQGQATLDGADRLEQRTLWNFNTPTIADAFTYDPDGHVVGQSETINGQTVSASAGYNAAGWETGSTDNGLATSYGYDAAGRLRTTSLPTLGSTLAATVDAAGRVTALAEGGTQATYGYDADDQSTQASLPGGVSESTQYDVTGRLTQRTISGPGLSESYSYAYNPAGWMTSIVSSINGTGPVTTTLTHDAFGHLTGASTSGGSSSTWAYGYQDDSLSSAATSGAKTLYYAQAKGLLVSTSQSQGQCATPCTEYFEKGAGISKVDAFLGGGNNWETQDSYDAAGRPSKVVRCSANYGGSLCAAYATATASMGYNARGQRASYASTGTWGTISEQFWYRGGQLAQVATVSGTTAYTDTYLYDPSGAPYELVRQTPGGGPCGSVTCRYWYETDGQGNVVALTDVHGNVVDSYQYDAWGAPTSVSEQVPQRLRYRGYWYDAELGTYWLSVRQYDPALKQFLQADPSQAEGLASYAYAKSDPVDLADPSGLMPGGGVHGCLYEGPLPDGICPPPPGQTGGNSSGSGNSGGGGTPPAPCPPNFTYDPNNGGCYEPGDALPSGDPGIVIGQGVCGTNPDCIDNTRTTIQASTGTTIAAMCDCEGGGGGDDGPGGPGVGGGSSGGGDLGGGDSGGENDTGAKSGNSGGITGTMNNIVLRMAANFTPAEMCAACQVLERYAWVGYLVTGNGYYRDMAMYFHNQAQLWCELAAEPVEEA